MQTEAKKATAVCLTALILSIIFFTATLVLSKITGVFSLFALSWLLLAAVVVWAVLAVQFYQKKLAEQEKLDMAQLQNSSGDTIFESQKKHAELFAVAQGRLKIFEKWFLPVFSLFLAAYQIAIGIWLLKTVTARQELPEMNYLLLGAVLSTAIAFLSFLFAVYTTGLSTQSQWRPMRAGGSLLLAVAVAAFLTAAAMAFAQFKVVIAIKIFDWVVPVLMLTVGAEVVLNFVLNIYRPRIKGQYFAAAFDSKLLAVIAAPGSILHTAAATIDYQFGFKVSQTWFYKIIEQAVVPLLIVSAVILYLLSCIVIINPESQGIIERFGSPFDAQGNVRIVQPGISLKLPWPFDIARKYPAKQIQEIYVGYVPDEEENSRKPLLWNQEHYKHEYNILVATEGINSQEQGAVPVSIIRAAIPVQYQITDLYKYLYNYADSKKVLESVCYRELIKFAAGARIETDSPDGKAAEESLLGAGRAKAAELLVKVVQQKAEELDLGVKVIFMGLQGFHPPPSVAEDFQAVIGAVQQKQAAILEAIAWRDGSFTNNAGSVKQAEQLYALADDYTQASMAGDNKKINTVKLQLDEAFANASGDLFAELRKAKSYAYEKATLAEATGKRFADQLKAYNSSKMIYKHELKMSMLEEALEKIRKYIVVADADSQVTIIDLQEKLMPDLYDIEPVK